MEGWRGFRASLPLIMRNNIRILGQWMYPREATTRMVGLVGAGLLNVDGEHLT